MAEPGERATALDAGLRGDGYQVAVVADGFGLLNAWTFPWLASGLGPFEVIVVAGPLRLMGVGDAVSELRQFSACDAAWVIEDGDPDRAATSVERVRDRVCAALLTGAGR